MLKPTAYLTFSLDADTFSPERAASIVRTYSYICPVDVREGESNAIAMNVKLPGRPWFACGNEADATWENVVKPWLANKLRKLEETVQEYNNEQARSYCGSVAYRQMVVEGDGGRVACAIENDVLSVALDAVEQARCA